MAFSEKLQKHWRVAVATVVPSVALAYFVIPASPLFGGLAIAVSAAVGLWLVATANTDQPEEVDHGSKEYLDAVNLTLGVVEFSVDGTITSTNSVFRSFVGFAEAELTGQPHRQLVSQNSNSDANMTLLWDKLRAGQRVEGTFERRHKDGSTVWLKAAYQPVVDANGAVVKVIKFAENVTQARADAQSSKGLRGAIDQSLALIEFTPDGTILSANQNFLKVMEYAEGELPGQHHRIFMRPEDAAKPEYQSFWKDLASGHGVNGECIRQTKSGKVLRLHASYNPIRDESGQVIKIVKLAQDFTEEKLRAAEYAGKIAAIDRSQAVLEYTLTGEVTSANDIATRELGMTAGQIKGRSFSALLSDNAMSEREVRSIWERLSRGEPVFSECCFSSGDGEDVWFSGTLHPLTNDVDEVVSVVHYMDNVTERKANEIRDQLLRASLERLTTVGIMVADADYNIKYLNRTISDLFRSKEGDIRNEISGFQVDRLLGANIDIFHQDPSHQRRMLDAMTSRHVTDLELGGLTLRLEVNPTFDDDGNRIGTVVEWLDRTAEVAVERAIQDVVESAVAGDLSKRIDEGITNGFLDWLPGKINHLVGTSEQAIDETAQVLNGLSRGDLTNLMHGDYRGSYAELKENVNRTVAKLTEVVTNIQGTTNLVKTGVSEISQGNVNLSHRTEQQASSLEETASSMEQMTSTVKQNADNAEQANTLAMEARDMAERGGSVVRDAVNAMAEISDSSRKIADIIGVIDEIAFQTNLLALNASVEAARAGEQGRGFAVVAREVRDLAGRSATAAKQIKDLIEDSGQRVVQGSKLVNQSGETLDEIVVGIKRVTDIVGEITVASQEQAVGIDEVNRAVIQLDQLTQQNAALVEEAAAASESMGEQADELDVMMRFFSVSDGGVAFSAPAGPPGGVERRSAERPWAGGGAAAAAAPAPVQQASLPPTGTGDEWEDF